MVSVAAESTTAKPKEAPKPKRKPPALPEDRKRLKERWPLIRQEIDDAFLKGTLEKVEVEFKDDEFVYLVCELDVYEDLVKKKIDVISEAIEKEMEKSFEIRTTTKKEYDKWYEAAYGKQEEAATAEEDAEFASLLGQYFPEADVE